MKTSISGSNAEEITLYHDFSEESVKTRKLFDICNLKYKGIVSNSDSNWYLPFMFIGKISYRIRGIDQIVSFLFEELKKDKKEYYDKIILKDGNNYLQEKKQIWMLESLFREEEVFQNLLKNEMIVSDEVIEDLMEKSDFEVYINEHKSVVTSQPTDLMKHNFGNFHKMGSKEALKLGIAALEQVKEKGHYKIK